MNHFSQDFCAILFEHSTDGLALSDQNGLILQANRAFASFYASEVSTLVGLPIWSVLPSESQENFKLFYNEMFKSGISGSSFETILPSGGAASEMLETTFFFEEPAGQRTKVLSIVRNVTEKKLKPRRDLYQAELDLLKDQFQQLLAAQKEVELHLLASQAELRKSEQLFFSIAKNFPNGAINVIDKNYCLVFTDGSEYTRLGLDAATFIGLSVQDIFSPQLAETMIGFYQKAFRGERFCFEFENLGQFYEKIGVPLFDVQGNINQILTVTLNISEKRKSELAAKEQESRLRAIAENLPGVAFQFALNPDGKMQYNYISEKILSIFSISSNSLIEDSEKIVEFIHIEDLPSFFNELHRSAEDLSPFYWSGKLKVGNTIQWTESFSSPRKLNDGTIVWDGMHFNITERIEREKQIKRFDEQLKLIIKNAPIVLWATDKEGRFTLSEGKGLEKLGLKTGEAVGASAFELYSFNKTFIESLHKTLSGGVSEFETFDVVNNDEVAFKHILQPTYNELGEVIGLLAISIDATEEYRAKESESRYRALANNIPGAVFQAEVQPERSRQITFVGESIRQFGIESKEILGNADTAIRFLHPEDVQGFLNVTAQSYSLLKPFRWEGRTLIRGNSMWVEIAATPRRSDEGVVYWEGIILDITERKDITAKLNEAMRIADIATIEVDFINEQLIYSDRHLEQLGTSSELLGTNLVPFNQSGLGFTLPEDLPIIEQQLQRASKVQASGYFVNEPFEYRIKRADTGEVRTMYVFKTEVFRDENGKAIYAIATVQDITERKKLEQDLSESRSRLQAIIDSTNDYILAIDANYRISAFNRKTFDECIGHFQKELHIGDSIFDFVLGDKEKWKDYFKRCFAGEIIKFNYGTTELFENTLNPVRNNYGKVMEVSMFSRDVTEIMTLQLQLKSLNESLERQVQERTMELRQSEQLYRAIAENYPSGMVGIYDRTLRLLFTDGMEYQRLGIDTGYLIEKSLFEIYPDSEAHLIASYFKSAFQGQTVSFEIHLGDSDYFYLISPIPEDNGSIDKILVVTQNITERKQADRILRENEERYRLVLEQTGQLVYDLDLVTNENKWSGAVERLTGFSPSEYQLSLAEWVAEIHPDDRAFATMVLEETMRSGLPYRVEYRYSRKDRSYFWVEDNGVYLKDATGKPVRMLGAMKDISTQKEMELEKARITEKALLAQKMESIGTLASGIAHEFNNLLAIISLSNEQVKYTSKSKLILKSSDVIHKTVQRGSHIARQLLDFSRTERTEKQPIELSKLIDEISATLRQLLKKNITIETAQSVEQAWIMGNDKQIYQVLLNLGINAGDAMEHGGKLTYSLSTSRYNGEQRVVIRVKDSGSGIPPEVQARMFEPFFTTKGVGKGTGLGLSIVHGIVISHSGTIDVQSEIGKGSLFTLSFPVIEISKLESEDSDLTESSEGDETLLVVEDEPYLRNLLAKMLRSSGYTVFEASDGEEALKIFTKKKEKIDLVLTDMGMPQMDGYELFKKLRRKKKEVKVVVMTGYMDSEQQEKLSKNGIEFITKPFQMHEISILIRNALSR